MCPLVPPLHREAGFEFYFLVADRNEPPHAHVRGNDGRAKLWLRPNVRLEHSRGYNRAQVAKIRRIATTHQEAWLATWERRFSRG